jgi:hypothetical protein
VIQDLNEKIAGVDALIIHCVAHIVEEPFTHTNKVDMGSYFFGQDPDPGPDVRIRIPNTDDG